MAASSGLSGKMFCLNISKEMLFFIILAISIIMVFVYSKMLLNILELVIILSKDVSCLFFLCASYCSDVIEHYVRH